MASVSSLSAPGVEVREYDQSLRITSNTGTTVFVPGFASQGPVEEVLSISSITDFENIYGIPTNAAERYFYYTVLAILNNSGAGTTVLTSRLAYGNNEGDNVANDYTMLVYPAVPVTKNASNKKGYEYRSFGFEGELSTKAKSDTEEKKLQSIFTLINDDSSIVPVSVNCEFIPVSSKRDAEIKVISLSSDGGYCLPALDANYYKDGQKYALKKEEKPTIKYEIAGTTNSSPAIVLVENDSKCYTVSIISQVHDTTNVHYGDIKCVATYKLDELSAVFTKTAVNPTCTFAESTEAVSLGALNEVYTKADTFNAGERDSDITYIVGAPATYNVSLDEYYTIVAGEYFKWSDRPNNFKSSNATDSFGGEMKSALSNAAFITINTSRAIVNDSYEGYYLGMTDNLFNEPSDDYTFDSIKDVKFTNWNRQSGSNAGIIDVLQNGKNEFVRISDARLDFLLASNNKGSISNILQTSINAFDTSTEEFDDTVNMAIFKLAKSTTGSESMKLTYSIVEKFNASFGKTRTHSVSNAVKPQNYFVESIVASSKNMTIMVNPHISSRINIDINGILHGKIRFLSDKLVNNYKYYESKYLNGNVTEKFANDPNLSKAFKLANSNIENWRALVDRVGAPIHLLEEMMQTTNDYALFAPSNALYPFATYTIAKAANKYIGNVPSKITRALDLISNDEEYPDIDILVEGGLGTIYAYANAKELISEGSDSILIANEDDKSTNRTFVEDAILQGIEDLRTARTSITEDAEDVVQSYLAVQNAFQTVANSFQNGGRGDTFYVADILRGILIRGANTKVEKLYGTKLTNEAYGEDSSVKHSWSTSIYSPIKHLIESFTTSYASVYAQWVKIDDGFTNERYWVPVSGYMTALMCASDQLQGPWYAAAGLNRGIVNGVIDCAINPNQKQRGDLYKICVNSVPKLANIGITNWGIRTLSKKASAFDQNTCRRTFLFIEKAIKKLLRYYLFEPNNAFTQLSIYNEIQPYMESIRNQGGIYSFSVVCNSTNNTSEIVNAGNLVVDVSAAPTRTAEFIVLNMTANKYDSSVSTSEFGN